MDYVSYSRPCPKSRNWRQKRVVIAEREILWVKDGGGDSKGPRPLSLRESSGVFCSTLFQLSTNKMGLPVPQPSPSPVGEQAPAKSKTNVKEHSSSLPFGQPIALSEIAGPTYVTAQTLVQQVAFSLSDRLWTYSPDTFDLDVAVKSWFESGDKNIYGYGTGVESMQVRSGAASIALGYMFSKDFDLEKRQIPQSIIASSSALRCLRSALDQLSLLYSVANPTVLHIAAVDYVGGSSPQLVTDYASALALADDLGLGLVASFSAHESQHTALFATLLARVLPTLHIYDGVKAGRETTRVIDVLDQSGLERNSKAILKQHAASIRKYDRQEAKTVSLMKAFNDELGTDYGLFEYHGHPAAEFALVVFGTIESSLASQIARLLEKDDAKFGVVCVRVYRPFVEEEFLKIMPKSVNKIGVLGQVRNELAVSDPGIQSSLYKDVMAAFTFAETWETQPEVLDIKYPRDQEWEPLSIASAFQFLSSEPILKQHGDQVRTALQIIDPDAVQEYTLWNLDESSLANASIVLGQALAKDSASNVTVNSKYDNLIQGGVQRTDIRKSKRTLDACYSVKAADAVWVGDDSLLKQIDVLGSLKPGGKVVLRLPGVKDDDLEKKLSVQFRKLLSDLGIQLFVLDPDAIEGIVEDADVGSYLTQLAFIRVAMPSLEGVGMQKLAAINGSPQLFENLSKQLDQALRQVEVPQSWSSEEAEKLRLPRDVTSNSFVPFDRTEEEPPALLKDWKTAAKALVFKEAMHYESSLRPDLGVQTWTITLMEHRRLTPLTYDRNIMHLEFDLGDSGLQYNIGDSLGVHPQNDRQDVEDFIKDYGLNPEAIVEFQSRDDPSLLRSSTVYQALLDQLDIFGRPSRQFYELLAPFATDPAEEKSLRALGGPEGATEFKRRAEVDTITYADVLAEFPSAHPPFHDLARLVAPLKRREYSIASCQKVTPTRVALMIVTVLWTDPRGRARAGLATRYLDALRPGAPVTVSLKPSVMKLPPRPTDPIVMAGLGTGLAPFRAFVQHRAWEAAGGVEVGPVLLYMGSRHRREEYCYGEEWEAYRAAGVVSLLACAFSRDQPRKVYIQDRMRETRALIEDAYLERRGSFYLCGPTWPVPDVTEVLEDVIRGRAGREGKKVNSRREIEKLKDEGRYVLEVY